MAGMTGSVSGGCAQTTRGSVPRTDRQNDRFATYAPRSRARRCRQSPAKRSEDASSRARPTSARISKPMTRCSARSSAIVGSQPASIRIRRQVGMVVAEAASAKDIRTPRRATRSPRPRAKRSDREPARDADRRPIPGRSARSTRPPVPRSGRGRDLSGRTRSAPGPLIHIGSPSKPRVPLASRFALGQARPQALVPDGLAHRPRTRWATGRSGGQVGRSGRSTRLRFRSPIRSGAGQIPQFRQCRDRARTSRGVQAVASTPSIGRRGCRVACGVSRGACHASTLPRVPRDPQ